MIDLDELIEYWQERQREHPPMTTVAWLEAVESTVAYLEQYKDTQIMLKDLANPQLAKLLQGDTAPLQPKDLSFPGENTNP